MNTMKYKESKVVSHLEHNKIQLLIYPRVKGCVASPGGQDAYNNYINLDRKP
jgi:hypothetical protein